VKVDVVALLSQAMQSKSKDKFHCFLSHNWGKLQADGSYDNHERVRRIYNGLQSMNISCWFDSERVTGTLTRELAMVLIIVIVL
jgi:hypothetical protein